MDRNAQLNSLGEYRIHDLIAGILNKSGDRVVGDDAAYVDVPFGSTSLVLSVDRLARNVADDVRAKLLVTQTLSDIIASNAVPLAMMLAVQVPATYAVSGLLRFVEDVSECARLYGCSVVGGDTKDAAEFSAHGIAIGVLRPNGVRVTRAGVRPGDVLCVVLADGSRWGRRWVNHLVNHFGCEIDDASRYALAESDNVFKLPQMESYALIDTGHVSAGLDLSDGLGAATSLLSAASRVGFKLRGEQFERLVDPLAARVASRCFGLDPVSLAMSPGYNWDNLYSVRPDGVQTAREAVEAAGGDLVEIGTATSDGEVLFDGGVSERLAAASDEKFRTWPWEDRTEWWIGQMREHDA